MKKKTRVFAIILILLFIGLGFAFLFTTLEMNGTASIVGRIWDVHWGNIRVSDGSVTGAQVISAASINNNEISFEITLDKPGDYYEFTVDAINGGNLDAMIDTVEKKINNSDVIPDYLNYVVTYTDGLLPDDFHLLEANSIEKYIIRVEYKKDIENNQLVREENALTLNVTFDAFYVQADGDAIAVPNRVYNVNYGGMIDGQTPPSGVTTYTSYRDAITAFGAPIFLKHILDNGVVDRTYLGVETNNHLYYLSSRDSVTKNKTILNSIFGAANCLEENHDSDNPPYTEYRCADCLSKIGVSFSYNDSLALLSFSQYDIEDNIRKYCYVSKYNGGTEFRCGQEQLTQEELGLIGQWCPSS